MRVNEYNWTEIFIKADDLLSECGVEGGIVDPDAKLLRGSKPVCHVKIEERGNIEAIKKLLEHDNVNFLYGCNVGGKRYKRFSITINLEEEQMSEVKDFNLANKAIKWQTRAKTRELFELIRDNPDLPILPFVDSEIVADDGYNRWIGSWGSSHIIEYVMVEMYNDYPEMVEKGETEQYEEFLYDCAEMTEEEVQEHIKGIEWIKAIAVNIDLPD